MANARLVPLDINSPLKEYIFGFTAQRNVANRLAPNHVSRRYSNTYVSVPIALADHVPEEWKSTNATVLNVEFEIYGDGQASIDAEERILRKFMRKERRTGEPPDLLFQMGSKVWKCRLHDMTVTVTLWNEQTDEQRAKVVLMLHTIGHED